MDVSRTIFRDMQALADIGLDGTVNCQYTRCALPVGLPMYGMARALFDRNADFDAVADEYFEAEFGEKGSAVRAYLEEITRRFDPAYLRAERPRLSEELAATLDTVPALVGRFRSEHPELRADSEVMAWRALSIHADLITMLSMLLSRRARGIPHEDLSEAVRTYVPRIEMSVQSRFDGRSYVSQLINRFAK
jgi:hypothetical protein